MSDLHERLRDLKLNLETAIARDDVYRFERISKMIEDVEKQLKGSENEDHNVE